MELETAIRQALPGVHVSARAPDRDAYARDLWPRRLVEIQSGLEAAERPSAVVWPENVEHVVRLVELAQREGFALVPFGAGSGVCGGIRPDARTVVVDLKRFTARRILPGPTLEVGAGALGITLEDELLSEGYTTGHYPSSILCSTVGGWVAARGAGQCSGRYGKIEDMVTSLEVVLGTGEVVSARRRTTGPDLLPLIVGSEGTLGIVTRVGLRLYPAPRDRRFAAFEFPSMDAGIAAVRALFQSGLRPSVVRLYDPLDTFLLAEDDREKHKANPSKASELGLRGKLLRNVLHAPRLLSRALELAESSVMSRAALVLVHEGEGDALAAEAHDAARLCLASAGTSLGEGPARAWYRRRYSVSYRQSPVFRSGAFNDTMEVAAPWSKLPGVYAKVREALGEHVLVMAHLSHAYPDGACIYFTFAGTAHSGADSLEVYDRTWRAALDAALASGATLSHHHGVGRSKAPRLGEEMGAAISIVRALKRAWDPKQILNPGALLPEPSAAESVDAPPASAEPAFDATSCLAELPGAMSLGEAEAFVRARGHSLGVSASVLAERSASSIDAWIAAGLPGLPDRYADPAFAPLVGFTAHIAGRRIRVQPAPRRAVGPDLAALFAGAHGSFGRIERAALVALPYGAKRPTVAPFDGEREPELTSGEQRALAHVEHLLKPPA